MTPEDWMNYATANTELAAENGRLRDLIAEHNNGCISACGQSNEQNRKHYGCDDYATRGRLCPECPRWWVVGLEPRDLSPLPGSPLSR